MEILRIEETPNPAALKFVMDGAVVASGSLSFSSGEEDEEYIVENVPRRALSFSQQRYGSDFFIPQAFRHKM